jgi:hypothetical protein
LLAARLFDVVLSRSSEGKVMLFAVLMGGSDGFEEVIVLWTDQIFAGH